MKTIWGSLLKSPLKRNTLHQMKTVWASLLKIVITRFVFVWCRFGLYCMTSVALFCTSWASSCNCSLHRRPLPLRLISFNSPALLMTSMGLSDIALSIMRDNSLRPPPACNWIRRLSKSLLLRIEIKMRCLGVVICGGVFEMVVMKHGAAGGSQGGGRLARGSGYTARRAGRDSQFSRTARHVKVFKFDRFSAAGSLASFSFKPKTKVSTSFHPG